MPEYVVYYTAPGSCMGCPSEHWSEILEFPDDDEAAYYVEETMYATRAQLAVRTIHGKERPEAFKAPDLELDLVCPVCGSKRIETDRSPRGEHLQKHICWACWAEWETMK